MNQANKNYDVLFRNMAQGAFFQNKSGEFFDITPAALKILGLTREQLLGRTARHPDCRVIK
jgi:PAS domain S-box-containing protein